ncbi:MAG: hypothetical protein WBX81_08900 [Nitrososphaeraceae archaeon]
MTNVEGSPTHIHKGLLSSYRVIFVVVSAIIIGVLVETGIIRVSGFVGVRDLGHEITIFVVLGILCIFSQLTILNFVRNRVGKSFLSYNHMHIGIMNKAIVIVQLGIIVLLVVVLLEVSLTFSYHTNLIRAIIMGSFLTASVLTALLSWRFIGWIKSNKNRLMLVYLLASLFISASAIVGVVYFLDQLFYRPDVIYPKTYGDYLTHIEIGNSSLVYVYTISSAIAFVLLWTGTVFLLHSYRKKLGRWKYWILMSIPLLYFLSQFQPVVLNFMLSYVSDDPMLFNLVYIIMVNASRPIGGVLFGLAFILVAHKLQNREVKGYLVITGIGFLLLLVSYEAQALITAPFPPLGLLSGSYFGLASYLIFIGLYSSAVSISQDSGLRGSIRRSVELEVRFLGSIGDAEMDHRILDKVLTTSKKFSQNMPEETGVSSSLSDEEIKEYIEEVLVETHKKNLKVGIRN